MASIASALVQTISLHRPQDGRSANRRPHSLTHSVPTSRSADSSGRRQMVLLLTATTALAAKPPTSAAEDIGLFGLRKKLRKAEQEAEEIVKEGFEAAEKGIEAAEKGVVAAERGLEKAERGIETAEREIEEAVTFGGLAQAGAVVAAEGLGVLVATSVVNGILGPEGQRS